MKKLPDFLPEGMEHSDFQIGLEFRTGAGRWRCTDVGQRTITAIFLEDRKPEDLNGPPYSIPEHVFDEYDFGGCSKEKGTEK